MMEIPIVPLKGTVCTQYVRCCRASCRCQQGGEPHGPYHYRVWREDGRVRKEYVAADAVPDVQAACDAYRAIQDELRALRQQRQAVSRRILRATNPRRPR